MPVSIGKIDIYLYILLNRSHQLVGSNNSWQNQPVSITPILIRKTNINLHILLFHVKNRFVKIFKISNVKQGSSWNKDSLTLCVRTTFCRCAIVEDRKIEQRIYASIVLVGDSHQTHTFIVHTDCFRRTHICVYSTQKVKVKIKRVIIGISWTDGETRIKCATLRLFLLQQSRPIKIYSVFDSSVLRSKIDKYNYVH